MIVFFDEETDKRLLAAETEDEVRAIIAATGEADKLAGKTDLVMAEIARIKGSIDDELNGEDLDQIAGGSRCDKIYLSETVSCVATFYLHDLLKRNFCFRNDQCWLSDEYDYHVVRYSNCPEGGRHIWESKDVAVECIDRGPAGLNHEDVYKPHYVCSKCDLAVEVGLEIFNG